MSDRNSKPGADMDGSNQPPVEAREPHRAEVFQAFMTAAREIGDTNHRELVSDWLTRAWHHKVLPKLAATHPKEPTEAREASAEVLSDVDPVVLACWKLQGHKVGAMLRESQAAVIELHESLRSIGDFAHDKSTGPAVPDALWEVRSMAYDALRADAVAVSDMDYGNNMNMEVASPALGMVEEPSSKAPTEARGDGVKASTDALLRQAYDALAAELDPAWQCESYHPLIWAALRALREHFGAAGVPGTYESQQEKKA